MGTQDRGKIKEQRNYRRETQLGKTDQKQNRKERGRRVHQPKGWTTGGAAMSERKVKTRDSTSRGLGRAASSRLQGETQNRISGPKKRVIGAGGTKSQPLLKPKRSKKSGKKEKSRGRQTTGSAEGGGGKDTR